eukprot:TRINITY_DN3866_c0_g1_i1.p1 TRINITY_DN3866_c0_g1~~TRINITY_DN3866_c0_g1_i1.p1  ORF type:complete len:395 (+),score=48.54 TRINITY_DN3866_c0_g1_i1:52-1185(+)
MDRPADWACPNPSCQNHTRKVFGSKTACPKCGTEKDAIIPEATDENRPSKGMQGGDMDSDWPCPNEECINHTKYVFGKRASCPSCGTARDAQRVGDWLCPNTNCVNSRNCVFASKTSCPKCGTPKPALGRNAGRGGRHVQSHAGMQPMRGAPAAIRGVHAYQAAMPVVRNVVAYAPAPLASSANAMDWQCPNRGCVNHVKGVFAKKDSCPKCGSGKPMPMPLPRYGGGGGASAGRGGAPGDWQCPNTGCLNHVKMVFGKNETCPKCGAEKPDPALAHGRAGDWQCPNSGCLNHAKLVFGKHETCPKCGADKPLEPPRGGRSGGGGGGGKGAADWQCPNPDCQNHRNRVFGKHDTCPKCGEERPGGGRGRSRSPRRLQ